MFYLGPSNEKLYEIVGTSERVIKKFNALAQTTIIQLKEIKDNRINPEMYFKIALDSILQQLVHDNSRSTDQVGLTITNDKHDRPIFISFRPASQISSVIVMNEFEKVLQSNNTFMSDEPLKVQVTKIEMPRGKGKSIKYLTMRFEEFCKRKTKSILTVQNYDNLCLPRALVLGKAYANRKQNPSYYRAMKRKDRDNSKKEAEKLCREADVVIGEKGAGIEEVQLFQNYLQDYKITVFDGRGNAGRRGRNVLFEGEVEKGINIDLIFGDEHYNVITSLAGAFSYNYFCRRCKVGYDHRNRHRCRDIEICLKCLRNPPCLNDSEIYCQNCNRKFKGPTCYENHKKPHPLFERNKTVCEEIKYCNLCNKQYSSAALKNKKHKCNHHICYNCNLYVPYDHLCYVKRLKKLNSPKKPIYVFFDFECRIEDEPTTSTTTNPSFRHVPNYCVVQQQCSHCIENENITENCNACGLREFVISNTEGDELLERFFELLAHIATEFQKVYVFAHNGGGYDFQFLAEYMVRKEGWTPTLILNGSKIIQMTLGRIVFKDTLNFFHARLADLPGMFGIENTAKG